MKKKIIFSLLTLFLSFIFVFVLMEFAVRLRQKSLRYSEITGEIDRFSPTLGWELIPGSQQHHKQKDFDVTYHIGENGLRMQESSLQSNKRVLVLGDSFTFGIGLNDDETWPSLLQKKFKTYSFINAGVSGYSTEQMFLQWKELQNKIHPDVILLSIYLGNDVQDLPLAVPQQASRPKPYFRLNEDGGLVLETSHVQKNSNPKLCGYALTSHFTLKQFLLKSEFIMSMARIYRSYVPKSETGNSDFKLGLTLLEKILMLYKDELQNGHQSFFVVVIPAQGQAMHKFDVNDQLGKKVDLILSGHQIPFIDLTQPMKDLTKSGRILYHPNEGHWNREGSQEAAKIIGEFLEKELEKK